MDDIATKGERMTLYFFFLLECRRACQKVQKFGRSKGRLRRAKKFLNDNRNLLVVEQVGLLQELGEEQMTIRIDDLMAVKLESESICFTNYFQLKKNRIYLIKKYGMLFCVLCIIKFIDKELILIIEVGVFLLFIN